MEYDSQSIATEKRLTRIETMLESVVSDLDHIKISIIDSKDNRRSLAHEVERKVTALENRFNTAEAAFKTNVKWVGIIASGSGAILAVLLKLAVHGLFGI